MKVNFKLLVVLFTCSIMTSLFADSVYKSVPDKIDIKKKYLFFLHGNIVEKKGLPAYSKKYGDYEYEDMLEAFTDAGLVVIAEPREEDTDVFIYALKVKNQVQKLLMAGVSASNITVSGYSKGGRMILYVSSLLKNNDVNFVILAGCPIAYVGDDEVKPFGNMLSIYDQRDVMFDSCEKYFSVGDKGLKTKEIVLDTGEGHGLFYRVSDNWLKPMLQWVI